MRPRELNIGGFVPFSASDYPGHLCAVVFCQGCPWRCAYCHNPHLQSRRAAAIQWDDVLRFLETRRGLLDAVVFSGGEPTMQRGLTDAIAAVKALGLKAGLHTAGIYPHRLPVLLPLLDWIGLDVKAPFDAYTAVTGVRGSGARARQSLELVVASGVPYELRTTVDKTLLGEVELAQIKAQLPTTTAKHHVLQTCRAVRAQPRDHGSTRERQATKPL